MKTSHEMTESVLQKAKVRIIEQKHQRKKVAAGILGICMVVVLMTLLISV